MKLVTQQHSYGCAIACVAILLGINYREALSLFKNGKAKAENTGFYCREIVGVLNAAGLNYRHLFSKRYPKRKIYRSGVIVFLRRSRKYPAGHFVCRLHGKWMDPWANFPKQIREAGFRKRLPEKLAYVIFPI